MTWRSAARRTAWARPSEAALWGARTVVVLIALGLLSGCASLVHPGPAHLAWAQQRQPGVELSYLADGRDTYVRACGGCHGLKLPRSQPAGKWAGIVDDMIREEDVVLTAEEIARVVLFLEAAATVTDEEIKAMGG